MFFITSYPKWKRLSKIISQNYHILNQIKPCDNLILKSKFFCSKPKLSQGLILAQRNLSTCLSEKCFMKGDEKNEGK